MDAQFLSCHESLTGSTRRRQRFPAHSSGRSPDRSLPVIQIYSADRKCVATRQIARSSLPFDAIPQNFLHQLDVTDDPVRRSLPAALSIRRQPPLDPPAVWTCESSTGHPPVRHHRRRIADNPCRLPQTRRSPQRRPLDLSAQPQTFPAWPAFIENPQYPEPGSG